MPSRPWLLLLTLAVCAAGPALADEPVPSTAAAAAEVESTEDQAARAERPDLSPKEIGPASAGLSLELPRLDAGLLEPRRIIAGFTIEDPGARSGPTFEVCGPEVTFSVRFGRR